MYLYYINYIYLIKIIIKYCVFIKSRIEKKQGLSIILSEFIFIFNTFLHDNHIFT